MNKTKIEWTDYVWNPIKGICPVGCKLPDGRSYCYARRMYQRFGWNPTPKVEKKSFFDDVISLMRAKPRRIFLCSTFEIFHPITLNPCPWYPKITWRDAIFNEIANAFSQHTFQILTKFPQNIDRPMPDNVWLGCTITNPRELPKIGALNQAKAKLKFISFEPLLENIDPRYGLLRSIKWVIIGRLTGCGHKYDPTEIQLKTMFTRIRATVWSPPIFLKNNLKEIWGEPLIQEFPPV